jgi:hypothetical protein
MTMPKQKSAKTLKKEIIDFLRSSEGRSTRAHLWTRLELPDFHPTDEYWIAEQELVDTQKIERRRGRKGGIYLLEEIAAETKGKAKEAAETEAQQKKRERNHYVPSLNIIENSWMQEFGFKAVFGAVTAHQGRRQTGGKWTRPDLIICTVSDWLFWPAPQGEVRTIEVKLFEALDVTAVYEAAAHRTRAHYAYLLVVNCPEEFDDDTQSYFDEILGVAARQGIGVISCSKTDDHDTWVYELDPTRSDVDPQAINQLLLDQMPKAKREAFGNEVKRKTTGKAA